MLDVDTNRGIPGIRISDSNPIAQDASAEAKPESSTITDANGAFTLVVPRRPRGNQQIVATLPPPWFPATPARGEARGSTRVESHDGNLILTTMRPAGQEGELLVRVSAGAILKGRVVRGPERRAVPNARLSIAPAGKGGDGGSPGASETLAQSRSDGTFSMPIPRIVPAFDLVAKATGGARGHASVTLPESGNPEDVEIVLREGGSISGVLLDADGKPAEGYPLGALPVAGFRQSLPIGSVRTGPDGGFHLKALPAASYHLVRDDRKGAVPRSVSGALPELRIDLAEGEHRTGVELRMVRGREISGYVRSKEREPIANAEISAYLTLAASGGDQRLSGSTDADGFYRIDAIPPGAVLGSVSAQASGYIPATKFGVEVSQPDIDFVLERAPSYRLVVRDEAGAPARNFIARWGHYDAMTFQLFEANARTRKVIRNSTDGIVPVEDGLQSGQIVFQVAETDDSGKLTGRAGSARMDRLNDPEGRRGTIDSRSTEIPITLRTTSPLRGVVRNGDTPAAGATITVRLANTFGVGFLGRPDDFPESSIFRLPTLTSGEDGTFLWPMAPRGAYELSATLGSLGTETATRWESTGAADRPVVELQLRPLRAVVGTVTGFDGKPMAGIEVSIFGSSSGARAEAVTTDREGKYRIETALERDVSVDFDLGEFGKEQLSATVPASGEVRIDLDLRGRIRVVLHPTVDGSPLAAREYEHAELLPPGSRGGEDARPLRVRPGGYWIGTPPPGTYWVRFPTRSWALSYFGGPIEVAAEPPEQEFRFDFTTHEVDLLLLLPNEADPPQPVPVSLVQEGVGDSAVLGFGHSFEMEKRSQRLAGVPAGKYELRIGRWRYPAGSGPKSGWVTIGPGKENVIVIEIDDPKLLYPDSGK